MKSYVPGNTLREQYTFISANPDSPFHGSEPWVQFVHALIEDGFGKFDGVAYTFTPDFWTDEDFLHFPELKDKTARVWVEDGRWNGELK